MNCSFLIRESPPKHPALTLQKETYFLLIEDFFSKHVGSLAAQRGR